ncbi:hypothetical protein BDZ45DRAFT_702525 [Acephala macrosclerotiorum]|nr:hypothetical protein BDZ45DRAFT_702525 [Acephala macrosclerotiorum]
MGFLPKLPKTRQDPALKPVKPPKGTFIFAGRAFPRIVWWKDANLRRLYVYIIVLILTNTANGFDGSMMNGLQTLSYWQAYFDHPKGSILGLFNASVSLGSLIGLFFIPVLVDGRGRKTGITLGCCVMLLATTYGTLKIRRLSSLLQSICSVIIFAMMWWILESLRWLINKDRPEEALRVPAHYHANDQEQDEFVQLEYAEITTAITLDKQASNNSWLDLVSIGFFSQWSDNGLISYYLHQLGVNGGLKTWGLIVNISTSFMVDRIGRCPTYLISTIGTFVVFNIWTIISAGYAIAPADGLGIGFVFMIFVYGTFYDFKSGLLASYTTEILPYGLRAKSFTWLKLCVTAALFFNHYVNAIALEALSWKYYLFYCFSRTRYTPLEEIAKYFDGEKAVDIAEIANAEIKGGEKVKLMELERV